MQRVNKSLRLTSPSFFLIKKADIFPSYLLTILTVILRSSGFNFLHQAPQTVVAGGIDVSATAAEETHNAIPTARRSLEKA